MTLHGRAARLIAGVIIVAPAYACTVSYRGPGPDAELNRADILRCGLEGPATVDTNVVDGLAGVHSVYLITESGSSDLVWGPMTLERPAEAADGIGEPPRLIGWAEIDASPLGASVPGDLSSREPTAPGVGVYVFPVDPDAPERLTAVLRFGTESNRRDRQRFDGAHTTLRITSIAGDRFGGTWSSAEGAQDASGHFCVVSILEGRPSPEKDLPDQISAG